MAPTDTLTTHNLTRHYPSGEGVHNINLTIHHGEIHALVGLNGAGKTTLMRLLLGMLKPDHGTVTLLGHNLQTTKPQLWTHVGHAVGTPPVYAELTTQANLTTAAKLRAVPPHHITTAVDNVLTDLNLEKYRHIRARNLSAGNRQRLGIATGLLHHPQLLILDEPTNALDPAGVISLRKVLLDLARNGTGILVSSHHLDEVARVADRITVINRGHTIGSLQPGTTDIEHEFFNLVWNDDQHRGEE
ncbi:ABC transporter ATP-binding protein [Natronoglycomyces albus]|uniref:ABC transporter ATP-binding protein n=1 Tax=Natronoglycomyces albus TaxID=2811108 RepID=A0A895XTI8_9ACTN|nr:ABC transporter ATP-binding protein [Natronoglycomyces albus]QSB06803.1 ABC transporter ATP-binding protein [Natronoglycomyces albus]